MRKYSPLSIPEILGNSNTKFKKPAQWMCSRHSIVSPCLRDTFTAGGQVDIVCGNDVLYSKVPRVVCNFIKHIESIRKIFRSKSDVYMEIPYYASYCKDKGNPLDAWKTAVDKQLSDIKSTKVPFIEEILKMEFVGEDAGRIIVRIL